MSDSASKMMRPFIWVKFPGLTGDKFVFHPESNMPGEPDAKYSYLTDFEYEHGTGTAEAKFTIVDYNYEFTNSLIPIKDVADDVMKKGGVDLTYQKTKLSAIWSFGWHVGDGSENPWADHTNIVPDKTEKPYAGIIKSIQLNISEGLYTYDITVGGPSSLAFHCFLPDKNKKGAETTIKGKRNAFELVKAIAKRAQMKLKWSSDAEAKAKRQRIEEDYHIGHKPIGYCINRILGTMTANPAKDETSFRVLEDMIASSGSGVGLFIMLVTPNLKKGQVVRKYDIGISRDNLVLDFSPTMDNLHVRGAKIKAQSSSPDGSFSIVKPGREISTVAMQANAAQACTEQPRDTTMKTMAANMGMAKQIHSVRNAFTGITAELNIVGDPGLQFLVSNKPGWGKTNGRHVQIKFRTFPYIDGPYGGLKWERPGEEDERLSGKYFITRVCHRMGAGQPYTTSLSLKKVNEDVKEIYEDLTKR